MPRTYHSVSPPGYTILDVDANAMLFVGGLTGKLKVLYFCIFSKPVNFIAYTTSGMISLAEAVLKLCQKVTIVYVYGNIGLF